MRNIVEKHHSQVHLVSEVGVGTTFWFDLAIFHPPSTANLEVTTDLEVKEINYATKVG